MRRIAKLSLLLAPLMLASASGCATPSWMSKSEPADTRETRANRLLAVAAEYEQEGKPEAAMRVYEHVLAQQPENTVARQHRDLLAQRGVHSGGRSLRRENPLSSGPTQIEMLASSRRQVPETDHAALEAEIRQKNTELAKTLARKQAQPAVILPDTSSEMANSLQPTPAYDSALVAQSGPTLSEQLAEHSVVAQPAVVANDAEWVSTPSSTDWKSTSLVKTEETLDDGFQQISETSMTSVEAKAATPAEKPQTSLTSKPQLAVVSADHDRQPAEKTVEESSAWTTVVSPKSSIELASLTPQAKVAKADVKEAEKINNAQPLAADDAKIADTKTPDAKVADVMVGAIKTTDAKPAAAMPTVAKPAAKVAQAGADQIVSNDTPWQTTDLTRSVEKEPMQPVVDKNWESTSLVTLCEDLPEDLVPLVKELESSQSAERVAALQQLGERGPAAKNASVAVYSLLKDSDPVVSVYAAGTLRQITGDAWSAVRTLSQHLTSENQQVAQLAAYLLGQMGPEAMEAVPALEKLRDSGSNLTGLHAAEALTHIAPGDKNSIAALEKALAEGDRQIRWFAAVSLGTVTGGLESQAVKALSSALHDNEAEVRIAACLSLGGLGRPAESAIPELEKAAQSDSPEVKSAAETALACLKI